MLDRYFPDMRYYENVDAETDLFLKEFTLDEIEPHLEKAFRRLDALFESDGLEAFTRKKLVRRLLMVARSYIAGQLFPPIELLIIDEAHKLKNPTSLRSEALRTIFHNRFRKAVFLTATPFQLDIKELKEVFAVFSKAKGATRDLKTEVDQLLGKIREYQTLYDEFQNTWLSLEPDFAETFSKAYEAGREESLSAEDQVAKILVDQITGLRQLKESEIEPGFRKWMIRSLRKDKRNYRNHVPESVPSSSEGCLPFLVYERFIAEIFRRRHRTHKAAAEINMVSSYSAAKKGAIINNGDGLPEDAEVYRKLLKRLLRTFGTGADGDHPKVKHVLLDSLDAADKGEKTLIFCTRIATLRQLRRELDAVWESRILARWREVYPDANEHELFGDGADKKGRHTLLQSRFHRTQDILYLALREPYLQTFAAIGDWASNNLEEIVVEANGVLQGLRLGKTAAAKIDYLATKRCVEHAAAKLWVARHTRENDNLDRLTRLCEPDFVLHGLDLEKGEAGSQLSGSEQPQWTINQRSARLVIGQKGSLWERCNAIEKLDIGLRAKTIESLARYLTFKQVPFLTDLLRTAQLSGVATDSIHSEDLLKFLPTFWIAKTGKPWGNQLNRFLGYFSGREHEQQLDILEGPIRTGEFARHTAQGQSREKLREAFNTPLFPMVLIANEVMQEGLDLHKQCRRVVHHDLVWNPAQVEQRIGRIDRLGSLTSLMRETDSTVSLDALYPAIEGTIDERMYRTVKTREKWLEFLLGAPPDFSEYSFEEQEPVPLPDRLAKELAIDLSPNVNC
ncbi:helicase-related protein [Mariniblastus fucicola]|nr:helicase-related protein [Mariniblastus fucicola]